MLLISFLPLNSIVLNTLLAMVFVLFSLTDFFDGYLARHYRQETAFGRLLDPLADKFLVYSTLITLVALQKLFFFWAIIIIGREFFIMGLREIALYYGFSVPVSFVGKVKTVAQVMCLTFIIINPAQQQGFKAPIWNGSEVVLLAASLFLTVLSALLYTRSFIRQWNAVQA